MQNLNEATGPTTKGSTLTEERVIELILAHTSFRTGIGYDVHRFAANRPLILAGVTIPYELGLLGHSDADVVTHAAMDAVLGAAGCRDIGTYFPDTDERFSGANSIDLAREVKKIVHAEGFTIEGLDLMVVAELPKLMPYIVPMKQNLAEAFGLEPQALGLKATTNEKMGWIGRGEGIAALASAVIRKIAI